MRLRAILTAGALAASALVAPVAVAPSLSAQGVEVPGVSAEAYQGWGTKCRTTSFKTGRSGSWDIYTVTTYRYYTTSLYGTTCQRYSTSKQYVWNP